MTDKTENSSGAEGAEKFPEHMILVQDIFSFSYEDAAKISLKFHNNAQLFEMFERVNVFLTESELPAEMSAELVEMIKEEADVISFSIKSKSSVISI